MEQLSPEKQKIKAIIHTFKSPSKGLPKRKKSSMENSYTSINTMMRGGGRDLVNLAMN
jgi:hypothetical protein